MDTYIDGVQTEDFRDRFRNHHCIAEILTGTDADFVLGYEFPHQLFSERLQTIENRTFRKELRHFLLDSCVEDVVRITMYKENGVQKRWVTTGFGNILHGELTYQKLIDLAYGYWMSPTLQEQFMVRFLDK